MDAISECEQVVRHKGHKEEDAPWRLYMRKELFVPWHNPAADPTSTELIYQQMIRGLKSDEYRTRHVSSTQILLSWSCTHACRSTVSFYYMKLRLLNRKTNSHGLSR